MDSIIKVFSTLSLSHLKECCKHLDSIIRFKRKTACSLSASNFVESSLDLVKKDSVEHETILYELESL